MRVLVTGGHGFIGSHLCARLITDGYQVHVLARPSSDLSNLAGLQVEVIPGDLQDPDSLDRAVKGMDQLFHLAGALKGFDEADLMRVNRDGTRNLVEACRAHAPELSRFIFVSSLAAAGPSAEGGEPRSEETPEHPVSWYGHSKLEAETVVRESGLPAIILRPPVVFGPRDRDVLSYFRMVRKGFLPVAGGPERFYSLIYAPDLAEGIAMASQAPLPAALAVIPLVNPEPVTWEDLGKRIAKALGRTGRIVRVPEFVLRAAGHLSDLASRIHGKPQIFSSQKVREMLAPAWVASPDPARRILSWSPETPLDEALTRTAAWYFRHDWL
jgi:2-alkyl-3-oxoalkanoate reductase